MEGLSPGGHCSSISLLLAGLTASGVTPARREVGLDPLSRFLTFRFNRPVLSLLFPFSGRFGPFVSRFARTVLGFVVRAPSDNH